MVEEVIQASSFLAGGANLYVDSEVSVCRRDHSYSHDTFQEHLLCVINKLNFSFRRTSSRKVASTQTADNLMKTLNLSLWLN
ncbi:hypothetical protein TNCV_4809471 [Trichonephila clavipes]|nr:hypothetical protein TNCV_4809471 [Trichonephila clavipes]